MTKAFKYLSLLVGGVMTLGLAACSADDHQLAAPTVTADELVAGVSFEVTPDAQNPNVIHLKSLVKGMTPFWVTPQGRSEKEEFTIDLPFAGDYEVTFGVITGAGPVSGNPYKFNVPQNDFSMLSDAIWTNLAGGVDANGNGNPKKWVPMDRSYGVGYGSAPVMYLDPEHVANDGVANKDLMLGSENWAPNWDPGFQSWLVAADDPYMESYFILGLDPVKGCTIEQMRKSASGEEVKVGTFSLNNSDPKRPTITFNDGTYAMHNAGMDGTCDNYTKDIKIIECTPYVLQLATMRTNSEGAWWLVWNFVAADVQSGAVTIPLGPELVEQNAPSYPEYDNLEESMYTVAGATTTYVGAEVVYHLDADTPYDLLQWDGAKENKWVAQGVYGTLDFPVYEDDFTMTLTRKGAKAAISNNIYDSYEGEAFNTTYTVGNGKIVFADEVSLLPGITGTEYTVFKCDVDNGMILGVPYGTDQYGVVNRYVVANLVAEPVGGAVTGPTVIAVDNSLIGPFIDNDNGVSYRFDFFNAWGGDKQWPVDINSIKIKKKQKMTITFRLDGVEWAAGAAPKAVLCHNVGAGLWPGADGSGFNDATAVTFNTAAGAETSLVYDNTNGTEAVSFSAGCLSVCLQQQGLVTSPLNDAGNLDVSAVTLTVTSITIE